ncbi:hypothetical protein [Actinomadura xylanilytica]|uniref:hypothetical protein n=1 Tax=Actinomadura xylanilytica TaxID=887459 RepID=UPI00255AB9AD|nr:hypothetical protein [Actinomadura xylanilytica]MDL4772005.1 hypothetical protein [Actinomadura xylanilytica]
MLGGGCVGWWRLPVQRHGRAEWCVSWWRTLRGRDTAARHLDRLALASERRGYRGVKLYPDRSTAVYFPMLLFTVWGPKEDVGVLAMARAVPGGWAYFDAFADPWFPFAPCRDV